MSGRHAVFDGHNDLLYKLWSAGDRKGEAFFAGRAGGHLDLARCRAGGFAGGLFAIWVPQGGPMPDFTALPLETLPAFDPIEPADARRATLEMMAIAHRMARARPADFRICRTAGEIETARAGGAVACVLHIEGAEAIGPGCDELEVLHAAGLRSLGPVWSRPNIFGTGVSFRFPGTPEEGPGLTEAGKRLVRACNRLGIVLDLSHLNAAGFRDVAALSDAPLVASHSNVHALCPSPRNLTDWQLDAIRESGGLVGVNFAVGFLREDGRREAGTPLSVIVAHLAHLVERLGETGVALGSDFDGAEIPDALGDAAGLPRLVAEMEHAGFGATLIERILWRNWVDLLERSLHPPRG